MASCIVRNWGASAGRAAGRPLLIERRENERVSLVEPVILRSAHSWMRGRLVDVSPHGAAVSIVDGQVPGIGEEMALSLYDGLHLWGRVCRIEGATVALEFPLAVADVDHLLCLEHRGQAIYRGRWP